MAVLLRAAATLLAAAAFHVPSLHAAPADSPLGVWLDHTGRGAVEIKSCGDKLCGHVVWVKSTSDAKGCGRQIIGDAAATGGGRVHTGWIYSPEKRKRYNVELSPADGGRLKVLGYAGTRLFSKTMYWTLAPADLQRCDGTTAAAAPAAPASPSTPAVSPPARDPAAHVSQEPLPAGSAPAGPVATAPIRRQQAASQPAQPVLPPRTAMPSDLEAQPGKVEMARPQPDQPAPEPEAASDGSEAAISRPPRRLAEILDHVLSRSSGGGDCRLDLPWVKVEFPCERD